MSERVSMPALGESVTEGTVTRWLKSVGDSVEVDEPLLEVSTDKVDTEIPSPVAGTLLEILAQEDDTVEVGADLAVVGDASQSSGGDGGSGGESQQASQEAAAPTEEPAQDAEVTQEASAPQPAPSEEPAAASSGGGEVTGGETVTMPALGESVTEGTVTRWLKSEGDTVEVDEPLVEVSTDKVDTEIPSPVAGVLTKILAGEDETVEVGGELAIIGGESSGGGAPSQPAAEPAPAAAEDDEDTLDELDRVPAVDTMVVPPEQAAGVAGAEDPRGDRLDGIAVRVLVVLGILAAVLGAFAVFLWILWG